MEVPPLAEEAYPRNLMVEQPKHNVSGLQFGKLRTPSSFVFWTTNFKTEVCSSSGHPKEAMPWIKEVEMANLADDLKTSRSVSGRHYLNFATLDTWIVTALKKTSQFSNLKKKIFLEVQNAQKGVRVPSWQTDLRILQGDKHPR